MFVSAHTTHMHILTFLSAIWKWEIAMCLPGGYFCDRKQSRARVNSAINSAAEKLCGSWKMKNRQMGNMMLQHWQESIQAITMKLFFFMYFPSFMGSSVHFCLTVKQVYSYWHLPRCSIISRAFYMQCSLIHICQYFWRSSIITIRDKGVSAASVEMELWIALIYES